MNDYIVVDNILSDPNELVALSRVSTYYTFEDRIIDGVQIDSNESSRPPAMWRGYRSRNISKSQTDTFKQIISKSFDFDYTKASAYLAIIPEFANYDIPVRHWWHTDQCSCAGVIYLNKTPEPNSETILVSNGEEIVVENKFNRLVLYKNILHRPQRFFGTTIEDSRLTFTFFV